jgi:4-alpha-glucanotransferase
MSNSVALLFGVHAHQPVGNFDFVVDDAHRRCYQPFLHLMHRFPDFHFSIHISGWLFDHLLQHFPADIELLREMVQRGQAEAFGAGYSEPVLAAIPVVDRIGQIERMSERMEEVLGQPPQGAWLTERVWESGVVPSLVDCGVKYVTVDDYHFLCAGRENEELNGFFSTEEDGRRLDLYPISEALRYRVPFSVADDAVRYVESLAGEAGSNNAAIYFDDIEKFGIWPNTYEWVYEKGWLAAFIEGVLASDIIKPMRYSDYHKQARTRGVVYLPTTSYIEMNEWTLPARPAQRYASLVQSIKDKGSYDNDKAFLRGGIWRNFFSRYPESNWMHKRMLQLSGRYHALSGRKRTAAMRDALHEAQANDAYWHGLFGGLYLPHLRRAVYNAIVRLEGLLDRAAARPAHEAMDIDLDGNDEILIQNGKLQAILMGDGSASICELDAYVLNHNFADTLTRQLEHYHRKVVLNRSSQHRGEGISSPHENVGFKHVILPEDLATDEHRRTLFTDRIAASGGRVEHGGQRVMAYSSDDIHRKWPLAYRNAPGNRGAQAHFISEQASGSISKQVSLHGSRLVVEYRFDGAIPGIFETELNIAMPGCDGPAGCFTSGGHIYGSFGQRYHLEQCREITLEDEVLGGKLKLASSLPANLHSAPCFSVSQSEGGFEKIMQSVTLQLSWPIAEIGKTLTVTLEIE